MFNEIFTYNIFDITYNKIIILGNLKNIGKLLNNTKFY